MKGWLKRWRKRIRTLIRRDAVDRELDEELAFHLEMETRKNLREALVHGSESEADSPRFLSQRELNKALSSGLT